MGDILTVIAVLAALVTIWYARATVLVARDARKDATAAHDLEMSRQAELLETTRTSHQREMEARALALERELWLQRLVRFARLQDLLWEAGDIGREEIRDPPPRIGGVVGAWTRLTGVLLRVEAELTTLEHLGGANSLPRSERWRPSAGSRG